MRLQKATCFSGNLFLRDLFFLQQLQFGLQSEKGTERAWATRNVTALLRRAVHMQDFKVRTGGIGIVSFPQGPGRMGPLRAQSSLRLLKVYRTRQQERGDLQ